MSLEFIFTAPDGRRYKTKYGIQLVPEQAPTPEPQPQPQTNRYFVLYYGQPLDANFDKITKTKPAFVVLGNNPSGNIWSTQVAAAYRNAGTKAIQYIAMDYGVTGDRIALTKTAMDRGFAGVFYDECDSNKLNFNKLHYDTVKSYGADKMVILNPGTNSFNRASIAYCDIMCVENYWFVDMKNTGIPAEKLMAVQGDPGRETDAKFQSADTLEVARGRLQMARQNGIQWYYSGYQNHHWMIQPFLEQFATYAR